MNAEEGRDQIWVDGARWQGWTSVEIGQHGSSGHRQGGGGYNEFWTSGPLRLTHKTGSYPTAETTSEMLVITEGKRMMFRVTRSPPQHLDLERLVTWPDWAEDVD